MNFFLLLPQPAPAAAAAAAAAALCPGAGMPSPDDDAIAVAAAAVSSDGEVIIGFPLASSWSACWRFKCSLSRPSCLYLRQTRVVVVMVMFNSQNREECQQHRHYSHLSFFSVLVLLSFSTRDDPHRSSTKRDRRDTIITYMCFLSTPASLLPRQWLAFHISRARDALTSCHRMGRW